MTWSVVGTPTTPTAVAATTITVTEPTGTQAGDLLVCAVAHRDVNVPNTPSGWTLIGTKTTGDTGATLGAAGISYYYCERGASPPTLVFTKTGTALIMARVATFRSSKGSVSGSSPLNAGTTAKAAADIATPFTASLTGITPTVDGCLLVLAAAGGDAGTWSALNTVNDGAFTDLGTALSTSTGDDGSLHMGYKVQTTAGATGNMRATHTITQQPSLGIAAFKEPPLTVSTVASIIAGTAMGDPLWTPAELDVAPRLWVRHRNATWSGSNLSSCTNAGSDGGSSTAVQGAVKGEVIGSFDTLRFNTASSKVTFSLGAFAAGSNTTFSVHRCTGTTNGGKGLVTSNAWAGSDNLGVYAEVSPNWFASADGWDNPSVAMEDNTHPTNNVWHLQLVQFGPVNQLRWDGTDGTAGLTVNTQGTVPAYGASTSWFVGQVGFQDEQLDGNLAELMVFDYTLAADDKERLEGWAAWEYGLTGNLPAGHPYKTVRPLIVSADVTANGATCVAPMSVVAGTASGTAAAAGVTVSSAAAVIGGTATISGIAAGATVSSPRSLIAGAATGTAAAVGATVTAPCAVLAGTASGGALVAGIVLTGPQSVIVGTASGTATAAGATRSTVASVIVGTATGEANTTGATRSTAASVIAGTAGITADGNAAGVTRSTVASVIVGTATGEANTTGATRSTAASVIAGTATGEANTSGVTRSTIASAIVGTASSTAAAIGATRSTVASVIAGTASGIVNGAATGATRSTVASVIAGTASGTAAAIGATRSTVASVIAGTAVGSGVRPWVPSDLAVAPLVWIDPSIPSEVTHSAGSMSAINNKGTGADGVSPGVSSPAGSAAGYPGTTIGGLNTILFDANVSDTIEGDLTSTSFSTTQCAVFQVVRPTANGVWGGYFSAGQPGDRAHDHNDSIAILENENQSSNITPFYNNVIGPIIPISAGTQHIHAIVYNTPTNIQSYKNGTAITAVAAGSTANFNFDAWRIGNDFTQAAGSEFLRVEIGETIFLGYLPTQSEHERIEGYFAWKWDGGSAGLLVGALPAGHPYKSAAPTIATTGNSLSPSHLTAPAPSLSNPTLSDPGSGPIASGTSSITHTDGFATSLTIPHTVVGDDRLLVVSVSNRFTGSGVEHGVYVGNEPENVAPVESWLGQSIPTLLAYTGTGTWGDVDPGWQISDYLGTTGKRLHWSIPMYPENIGTHTTIQAEVAAGTHNSKFDAHAAQLLAYDPGTHPIYIRTAWELGGEWFYWTPAAQANPTSFINAFRQWANRYHAASPRFKVCWDVVPDRSGPGQEFGLVENYYPGDAYVDLITQDVYWHDFEGTNPTTAFNRKLHGNGATNWRGLDWLVSFAAAHNKQIAIPEWGVPGLNGNTIDGTTFANLFADWMGDNQVVFADYWMSTSAYDGYLADNNPAGTAATVRTILRTAPGGGGGGGSTGITYNGDALTKRLESVEGTLCGISAWTLVAPDIGTSNLVVTFDGFSLGTVIIQNLTGVHQTTPVEVTDSANYYGTNTVDSITTLTANTRVWNAVNIHEAVTGLAAAHGTLLRSGEHPDAGLGPSAAAFVDKLAAGLTNYGFQWSSGPDNASGLALALKPIPAITSHSLSANNLTAPARVLTVAVFGQKHGLSAISLTAPLAVMSGAIVAQTHGLGAANTTTAPTPVLSAPPIAINVLNLGAANTTTAPTPVLSAPPIAINVLNLGAANALVPAAPVLSTPATTPIYTLTGNALVPAAPVLSSAAFAQTHGLSAISMTAPAPVLSGAAVAQTHQLSANNLTSPTPTLTSPTLVRVVALAAVNTTAPTPILGGPVVAQAQGMVPKPFVTAKPVFFNPGINIPTGGGGGAPIHPYMGVNVAGMEFNEGVIPGVANQHYPLIDNSEVDYHFGKDCTVLRLPFLWERAQPTLNGAFDAAHIAEIDRVVNRCAFHGGYCLLDPHNYGRRHVGGVNQIIGQSGGVVTNEHLIDLWTKLAQRYKSNPNVLFGLINEPHDQSTTNLRDLFNGCISAIRSVETTGGTVPPHLILVPGNGYSSAWNWMGSDNDEILGPGITDSRNNWAFEAHQYLNSNGDGFGNDIEAVAGSGVNRVSAITTWARSIGKKLFLGEFGIGRTASMTTEGTSLLNFMKNNNDVWIGWTIWAAGPWWGDYIYTVAPATPDRPQWNILDDFLTATGGAPGATIHTLNPQELRPPAPITTRTIMNGVGGFTPQDLYTGGALGVYFRITPTSLFSDRAGTIPAVVDGPVGFITDLSGGGHHAVAISDADRYTLKKVGNVYYLEGNGTQRGYEFGADTALNFAKVAFTAGFKANSLAVTWQAVIMKPQQAGVHVPDYARWGAFVNNAGLYFFRTNGVDSSTANIASTIQQPHVFTYSSDPNTVRVNESQIANGTDTPTISYPNNVKARLGSNGAGGEPFNGRVYGVVLINRPFSAEEQDSLEDWMNVEITTGSAAGYTFVGNSLTPAAPVLTSPALNAGAATNLTANNLTGMNPILIGPTFSIVGGTAQILSDASSITHTDGFTNQLTISHTVSGQNRVLMVATHIRVASYLTGITYNGVPLTRRLDNVYENIVGIVLWTLTAPATGTHDLVLTFDNFRMSSVVIESLKNVHQVTPIEAITHAEGYGTEASGSIITLTNGARVWNATATISDVTGLSIIYGTVVQAGGHIDASLGHTIVTSVDKAIAGSTNWGVGWVSADNWMSIIAALKPAAVSQFPLTPNSTTAPAPSLSSPPVGQKHGLAATSVTAPASSFSSPAFGQRHGLSPTGVVTPAPIIVSPSIALPGGFIPVSTVAPSPILTSAVFGQRHGLAPISVAFPAPVISTGVIGQIHALVPVVFTAPEPIFIHPAIELPPPPLPGFLVPVVLEGEAERVITLEGKIDRTTMLEAKAVRTVTLEGKRNA